MTINSYNISDYNIVNYFNKVASNYKALNKAINKVINSYKALKA
jgi:hypothetical protein